MSLIKEETIKALRWDHKLAGEPGGTRHNLVTRGVPLNQLVGRELRVEEAVFRGVERCEPCKHLVDVTGKWSLLPILIYHGTTAACMRRLSEAARYAPATK